MIIDKLYESVAKKGTVCVGLDTSLDYLPKEYSKRFNSIEDALFNFNKEIIDATHDVSACFKVQIAYYEAYGINGLMAYKRTLEYLRKLDTVIIADIKRGDIAKTAEMYAKAHFEGDFESDLVTLNPYMGFDSIEPYLPYVENKEKGLFVLLRTSNGGAKDIEYLQTEDGKKVYNVVGEKLKTLSEKYKGSCGYSSVGAVVGCTDTSEAASIRKNYKDVFFLIPGYGAQGGKAPDVALSLNNSNGGVINSSRAILLAYKKHEGRELQFAECSREEVIKMRDDIKSYTE